MKKRVISILLLVCMLCTMLPTQAIAAVVEDVKATQQTQSISQNPFTDVKESDWFYDGVQYARINGFFSGTSNTTFTPDGTMTRGMFVTVLGRMAGVDVSAYSGAPGFSDVSEDKYYAPYVAWAAKHGVTAGVGDGKFNPNGLINRQQMVTFFVRYFEAFGVNYETDANITTTPADIDSVAPYARDAVLKLWKNGLLNGDGVRFNPDGNASRAQAAVVCMRTDKAVDIWYKEPGVASERIKVDPSDGQKPSEETKPSTGGNNSGSSTTYYEVRFALADKQESEGVTLPDTRPFPAGTAISALPTPVKTGGVFLGWYYDAGMTQPAQNSDTVSGNMTLYAKVANGVSVADTPNYISAVDKDAETFTFQVKGLADPSELTIINISANNEVEEFTLDSDGVVKFTNGLKAGQTYKAELSEDSSAVFVYGDAEQPTAVDVFNFTTTKTPVDHLKVDGSVKFIKKDQVSGADELEGLFSLGVTQGGNTSMEQLERSGSFTYAGTESIAQGDTVAIYSGSQDAPDSVAYVEITGINGTAYTYQTADSEDVLFTPDVLPVSSGADTDGDTANDSITVPYATFDFSDEKYAGLGLDSSTTVDVGDFIAFYTGEWNTGAQSSATPEYKEITAVSLNETAGDYTVVYEDTTLEEVYAAMDLYSTRNEQIEMTDEQKVAIESDMVTQAIDSGFVDQAAQYLTALALETDGFQELSGDMDLKSYSITLEDGAPVDPGELTLMDGAKAEITKKEVDADLKVGALQHLTGNGISAELTITFEVTIGSKLVITVEAVFVQEVLLNLNVSGGAVWKWAWIFPYISDYRMTANIDLGTYTGVGITATAKTSGGDDDEAFDWKPATGSGTEAKIIDIGKQITDLMDQYETTKKFLNEDLHISTDGGEEGANSGIGDGDLTQKYSEMMANAEDSWVDLFRATIFEQEKPIDKLHILVYGISADFVVSANLYVTMGMTFEYSNAKRYSFCLELFHKRSTNETIDLVESNYQFCFYVMGTAGIRAGVEFEIALGLFSLKLDSIGITAEAGGYAQLWGYFYYQLKWTKSEGKSSTCAGALFVEVGIYLEITFKAQVFNEKFKYEPTLYEHQWPLWSAGSQMNVYDFADNDEPLEYKCFGRDSGVPVWFTLPESAFDMAAMDMKDGSIHDGAEGNEAAPNYCYSESFPYTITTTPNLLLDGYKSVRAIPAEGEDEVTGELVISWKDAPLSFNQTPIERKIKLTWKAAPGVEDLFGPDSGIDPDAYNWIYFDSMGGSPVEPLVIKKGETGKMPENPTRPGYTFTGWKVPVIGDAFDQAAGTEITLNDRYILNAQWEERTDLAYTLKFYFESLKDSTDLNSKLEAGAFNGATEVALHDGHLGENPVEKIITYVNENGGAPEGYELKLDAYTVAVRGDESTVVNVNFYRVKHDLTFNCGLSDLGTDPQPYTIKNVAYGTPIIPPTPQLGGYDFVKWQKQGTDLAVWTDVDFATTPQYMGAETTKYRAVWTPKTDLPYVQVHFFEKLDRSGWDALTFNQTGTTGERVYVGTLAAATQINNGTSETVGGFHVANNSGNVSAAVLDGSTTPYLYQYYERNLYKLYIHTDQAQYGSDVDSGKTIAYGAKLSAAELSDPTPPAGYVFGGWYTDQSLKNKVDENWTMPAVNNVEWVGSVLRGRVDLYAKYVTDTNVVYTVYPCLEKVDGSGYDVQPSITNRGETGAMLTLTNLANAPVGFTYKQGKADSETGSAVTETTVLADGSRKIYLYYDRNTHHVSWYRNADEITANSDLRFGAAITPPTGVTQDGCELEGWYTDKELTTKLSGTATMPDSDCNMYAKWMSAAYSIAYDLAGGSVAAANPTSYNIGTTTFTLTNPTREGYTFVGWTGSNGETAQATVTISTGSTGNKEYTATWTPTPYSISYAGGGTAIGNPTGYTIESENITLSNPTRSGYAFAGWMGNGLSAPTMQVTIPKGSTGDKTYTATWTECNSSVTFDANGGVCGTVSKTVPYQGTYGELPTPTYGGYTFAGWYTAQDGGTEVTADTTVANANAHTLYAHWTARSYGVSYVLDGGANHQSNPTTYTHGIGATLYTPTKTGHTFVGWKMGDTPVTAISAEQTGDITLTATWTADQYTVTFDANGGLPASCDTPKTVTFGEAYGSLPIPTRTNYEFVGWYKEGAANTLIAQDTMVSTAEDHTLYAKWRSIGGGSTTTTYTNITGSIKLWIGGQQITGAGDIPGVEAVQYVASDHRYYLTLNGYAYEGVGPECILFQGNKDYTEKLTIILKGNNTLKNTSTDAAYTYGIRVVDAPLTIEGTGKLDVNGGGRGTASYGIRVYCSGLGGTFSSFSLTIKGDCTVNASVWSATDNACAIAADSVTIQSSTVTAVGPQGGTSYGISGQLTVNGGTVTAQGWTRALEYHYMDPLKLSNVSATASASYAGTNAQSIEVSSTQGSLDEYTYINIKP